jgi:hypothetical protein
MGLWWAWRVVLKGRGCIGSWGLSCLGGLLMRWMRWKGVIKGVLWRGIPKDGRRGIVDRTETRKTKEDFQFEEIEKRKD